MVWRGTKPGYADRVADDDFTVTLRDCNVKGAGLPFTRPMDAVLLY